MSTSSLILMTTYNGDKYISQQIDSIVGQTDKDWMLLIRDDGSKDRTVEVIREYVRKDDRIKLIQNTSSEHGAYLNFWTLMHDAKVKYSNYDYYFFADQDDVWESGKLEKMIAEAEKEPKDIPLLLYGDMRIIDQNNRITYPSLNSVMGIGEMRGYSLFFTHGFLWGCDVCVNNALFNSMPLLPLTHPHIDIMSHDNYMGKYAMLKGRIIYIDRILINHRRHNNNTTGGYSMKLSPLKIFKRGVVQFDDLAKTHAKVYNQTMIFFETMKTQTGFLPETAQRILDAIRAGGFRMVQTMYSLNVKRKQRSRTYGLYLIALLKSYKKYLLM